MPINPIIPLTPNLHIGGAKPASPKGDGDFADMFKSAIGEVNQTQLEAKSLQGDLISNKRPVEYHDLMISLEKASTALQLTMTVRNKLLESYQEISRMQV